MTDTNTEAPATKTVQTYRHEARDSLKAAQRTLQLRSDATKAAHDAINGTISAVLRGRQGLSQEQQVEHLEEALSKVNEALTNLPEQIEAIKASWSEQIESFGEDLITQVKVARVTLHEAREYAASRDFEAHQASKGRSVSASYGEDYDESDEDESGEDDD